MVQESAVLMSGSLSSQHVTMWSRSRSSQCITMWSRSSQPVTMWSRSRSSQLVTMWSRSSQLVTMWSRSRSSQLVTMFLTLTLVLSCFVGQGTTFSLSELSQLADSAESLSYKLQTCANQLATWTKFNKMKLHPDKTKSMFITTHQKRLRLPSTALRITIDNTNIEQVNSYKCLGLVIDHNLTWSDHIHFLRMSLLKTNFQLARIKNFLDYRSRLVFL
ncbi:uncharacterized protein LOC131927995 [Physella acuta]|uniref:uncharacterized protein LOC131927995 n=1 Tax=Physella acuta TaxID=109671 RepID=UPI0027DAC9DA|nr:uncharacterized protein LOC131927995 [Physella acuta]